MSDRELPKTIVMLDFTVPALETPEGREKVLGRLSRDLAWALEDGWSVEYWGLRPAHGGSSWGPIRARGPRLASTRFVAVRMLLAWITHLALAFRRPRAGVLFANEPYAGLGVALLRRIGKRTAPFIVHITGRRASWSRLVHGSRMRYRIIDAIERMAIRSADLVLPNCRFNRRLAAVAGAAEGRVLEIPSATAGERASDVERLRAMLGGPHRRSDGSRSHPLVGASGTKIVCASRLSAEKGIDVLLRGFALLADRGVHLEIAGTGPERPELERLARRLGIGSRVRFHGWLDAEGIRRLFRGALVAVLPSRAEEGFCRALVEAGAEGCALVGTDRGGIPDVVVPGRTGILVPADDPAALAEAIQALVEDPEKARTLGEGARELATATVERRRAALEELASTVDVLRRER